MVPLHSFAPGGVERVALRLCGAWAQDPGLDVQLVMGREDGAMRGEAPAGLARHVTPEPFPTAAWESLWMMLTLPAHIRRLRPDVIFAAGNSYSVIAVAMKLWLGRRCPPVMLKISNDLVRRDLPAPARWVYHRWLRIQGRMIDHVTGLAEPMRAEIAARMHVPAGRIHIIDDPALSAIDLASLAAIGTARTPASRPGRHFVGIGRLARQKNWPLLLTAFARIAGADDTLTIVGEGDERARLTRLAASLGISDRLGLPGHGAIAPALAAADVFVLSSDYEGVPAVLIEALASGLPVVATDCAVSIRSLVAGFGSIVPVGDADALATAMAAQRPLDPVARAAAAAAMARFTVERAAGAYATLFGIAAAPAPST
ncbi:glycosyltransferase [Polymorphobacter fuscus]|uniref:Glycosyltransferase n=2 Tax=Sandarakinorhabdus fusca TaxID=1439888 RepID=A0A7C9GQN5_9SPHN|nr:glycosyltransferase [Polymorphobacter fuscus]MQT16571.1 glycosyltransferase [Polymorphobacter fuscus]